MNAVNIGAQMGPDYQIKLDDIDITSNFRSRLLGLVITDKRGMELDTLTLTLDDSDRQIVMPERGSVLRVYIGWQGSVLFLKGEFIITGVSHGGTPDQLTLTGFSGELKDSLKENHSESYDRMTLGNIVQRIARRNHLEASLIGTIAAISIDHIDQTNESDLQFCSRLAEKFGMVAQIKLGKLMLIKPGEGKTASGEPLPDMFICRQEGDKHLFEYKSETTYSETRAKWQRLDKGSPGWVTVKGKKTGTESDIFLATGTRALMMPALYTSQNEATQAAQAEWKKNQRISVSLKFMLAMGRPDLIPEITVKTLGFKKMIDDQDWIVTEVQHTMNSNVGYTSQVTLELKLSKDEDTILTEVK